MKCFLDMDGVLSDFVGGACKAHGRTIYDKPEHIGKFDMEKLWGISVAEFWKPTDNYDFWFNLEKTPEADRLVDLAYRSFGRENVAILTSPSLNKECIPAKRDWLKKYYPGLNKTMICAYGKGFLAGPGRVLVDDRDRNIEDFRQDGGMVVLVPRLWNKDYDLAGRTWEVVEDRLRQIVTGECYFKQRMTKGAE